MLINSYQTEESWVKKKLIKIIGILFALLIIGLVIVYFMLGSIIKKGVETVGPELTQGEMKLDGASLSVFGSGGVKGLFIGNPKNGDFTSPFAFKLGSADVSVQIGSLMSDKIIVNSIIVDGAEVCFDGVTGKNHQKIMENIEAYTGGGEKKDDAPAEEGEKKKIVIKLFKMTNTKVHLHVLGQTVPIPMPDFEKTGIGEGGDGATLKETVAAIYGSLYSRITGLIKKSGDLIKDVTGKGLDAISKGAGDAVDSVKDGVKGVGDKIKGLFD